MGVIRLYQTDKGIVYATDSRNICRDDHQFALATYKNPKSSDPFPDNFTHELYQTGTQIAIRALPEFDLTEMGAKVQTITAVKLISDLDYAKALLEHENQTDQYDHKKDKICKRVKPKIDAIEKKMKKQITALERARDAKIQDLGPYPRLESILRRDHFPDSKAK